MSPSHASTLAVSAGLACIALLASGNTDFLEPAALSAGSFTTTEAGANAFSIPSPCSTKSRSGNSSRAKSNSMRPGLSRRIREESGSGSYVQRGPLRALPRKQWRAKAPETGEEAVRGLLVRLSIPGQTKEGAPNPHPAYGDQLQNRGIPGRVPAEGQAVIAYQAREVSLRMEKRSSCVSRRFSSWHFSSVNSARTS